VGAGLVWSLSGTAESPPEAVVLISGRTAVDKSAAENVAEAVSAALGANGFTISNSPQAAATKLQLEGVADTATCSGRPDCVALMGKGFAPAIVVGLSIGRVGRKIAIQLSAVLPNKPQEIAKSAFLLPRSSLEQPEVHEPVAKFAKALHAWLAKHPDALAPETPPPPPPPPKEEVKVEPKPEVTPPPPVATTPEPAVVTSVQAPPPSRPTWVLPTGIVLGVLAVGAAGAGGFEGAGSISDGQSLRNNPNATLAQWQQASSRAQVADICYVGAVVLAAAAVVVFVVGSKSSSSVDASSASHGLTWDFP
jgi:hypothetical protein